MKYFTEGHYNIELLQRQFNYILEIEEQRDSKKKQEGMTPRDWEHLDQLLDYYMSNFCEDEFIRDDDIVFVKGQFRNAREYYSVIH